MTRFICILFGIMVCLIEMILRWCKWYGAAWLVSHFITSINPVDIGSILFIVETIISICVTLISMSKNKEQKSN